MNIAVISPYDSIGGAESYSVNLAKALSKLENDVTLFVNSNKINTGLSDGKLNVKYVRCKVLPIDPGNPFSIELMRYLLKENYDIIHVNQMYSFFNLSSSFCSRIKQIPIVLTDHGGGWRLAAIPYFTANAPNAFAAVSNFSLKRMLHFAPHKNISSQVIYGGVNTEIFHPQEKDEILRQRLNLSDNKTILYLGRLMAHKGVDILIKSLKYLPHNTKLLVVGQTFDIEYVRYLTQLANKYCENQVIFSGKINENELSKYYNLCDIYVQPSVYLDYRGNYHSAPELLGLAKLEAMACGKPVVVSQVGGLPEKIKMGVNGYAFEPNNEKQLSYYLNLLLSDENLRQRVGSNGLKTILNELTWDKIANGTLEFYRHLLNNN